MAERRPKLDTSKPFTRAQARAAGISARQLRGRGYRQVLGEVFLSAAVPIGPDERIVAALALHPKGARASHYSAARIFGFPVPPDDRVHVSVSRAQDRRWCPGLRPHLSPPGIKAWVRRGVAVSPPDRLMVEMASVLGLVDLVVLGDAIVAATQWTVAQLRERLADCTSYWSGAARAAVEYVRDGVDSPMESRLRMLLVLAGLPEPEVDIHLVDMDGVLLRRLDLGYPEVKVAVEYDGRHHVERIRTWEDDVDREAELREEAGWSLVKVISRGVYDDPARTIARVARALRERGVVVGPIRDDYRTYFPGRSAAA